MSRIDQQSPQAVQLSLHCEIIVELFIDAVHWIVAVLLFLLLLLLLLSVSIFIVYDFSGF